MKAYGNVKIPLELVLVVVVAIVAVVSFWTAMPVQQMEEMMEEAPVEIQEGQILDLANLPENMVLPNGLILKNVAIEGDSPLIWIISATAVFEEETEPLKMTWLDLSGDDAFCSSSSHTVLNSPSYYGIENGGLLKIWPLRGVHVIKTDSGEVGMPALTRAKKVKFETWE